MSKNRLTHQELEATIQGNSFRTVLDALAEGTRRSGFGGGFVVTKTSFDIACSAAFLPEPHSSGSNEELKNVAARYFLNFVASAVPYAVALIRSQASTFRNETSTQPPGPSPSDIIIAAGRQPGFVGGVLRAGLAASAHKLTLFRLPEESNFDALSLAQRMQGLPTTNEREAAMTVAGVGVAHLLMPHFPEEVIGLESLANLYPRSR